VSARDPVFWYLDGHTPVGTDDVMVWSRNFDKPDKGGRAVGKSTIGDVFVSTVFLGVDHNFGGGPPLLFETMVFRGSLDECQWRYSTWEEAEAGHAAVVAAVEAGETDPDCVLP